LAAGDERVRARDLRDDDGAEPDFEVERGELDEVRPNWSPL
jgi:hypothetical protein